MRENALDLKSAIRDVPDFPKKGIIFKDITTLISRGEYLREAIDRICSHFAKSGVQKIAGIESRGFIFGAPIAYRLGIGMVPVRKKGKLPYKTVSASYLLEYGTDTVEMHEDAVSPGEKVLIIDDLLATGGTASAAVELAKKMGADVVGVAFLIELSFLEGRKKLRDCGEIFSLIKY